MDKVKKFFVSAGFHENLKLPDVIFVLLTVVSNIFNNSRRVSERVQSRNETRPPAGLELPSVDLVTDSLGISPPLLENWPGKRCHFSTVTV